MIIYLLCTDEILHFVEGYKSCLTRLFWQGVCGFHNCLWVDHFLNEHQPCIQKFTSSIYKKIEYVVNRKRLKIVPFLYKRYPWIKKRFSVTKRRQNILNILYRRTTVKVSPLHNTSIFFT